SAAQTRIFTHCRRLPSVAQSPWFTLAFTAFTKQFANSNGIENVPVLNYTAQFEPDTEAAQDLDNFGDICDLDLGESIIDFPIYNARSQCPGC
ncbi:hypothetical protein, partial [Rhodopirellula bahusiensis]|uniref:hypothetical protein n=1 Tax=Rhodopirellula bahusiensis TaxID=2014065 RepID=UPI003264247A